MTAGGGYDTVHAGHKRSYSNCTFRGATPPLVPNRQCLLHNPPTKVQKISTTDSFTLRFKPIFEIIFQNKERKSLRKWGYATVTPVRRSLLFVLSIVRFIFKILKNPFYIIFIKIQLQTNIFALLICPNCFFPLSYHIVAKSKITPKKRQVKPS